MGIQRQGIPFLRIDQQEIKLYESGGNDITEQTDRSRNSTRGSAKSNSLPGGN